jgi:adenylate cyclase
MAKEIERKFLVADDGWRAEIAHSGPLRQGYLFSDEKVAVRVRTAGDEAFLTIKGEVSATERDEFEYAIPCADAEQMFDLCRGALVEKTRYTLMRTGGHWTVDVFSGANDGLVVVEVELAAAGDDPPLPAWIGREVTEDPRYRNAALSKRPFADW